ncbi:hypothetical protein Bca4012_006218 [Brassica carinata]
MAGEDGFCPRFPWKTHRRVLFRRRSLPEDEICRRHTVGVHIPASTMTFLSRLMVKHHAIDNLCYWSSHGLVVKARLSVRVSPGEDSVSDYDGLLSDLRRKVKRRWTETAILNFRCPVS